MHATNERYIPTLVYDGSISINDFLKDPFIAQWKSKEGFHQFCLGTHWGKTKQLLAEYNKGKNYEIICFLEWKSELKIAGTKGKK
jgi:hypothetical protein